VADVDRADLRQPGHGNCPLSPVDRSGVSWGEIATLLDKPGTFIRQPITVLENGNWLLPVFYCRTKPGEKWVGNDDVSAVKISADQGKPGVMLTFRKASAACI
jgi:hypothetical protein